MHREKQSHKSQRKQHPTLTHITCLMISGRQRKHVSPKEEHGADDTNCNDALDAEAVGCDAENTCRHTTTYNIHTERHRFISIKYHQTGCPMILYKQLCQIRGGKLQALTSMNEQRETAVHPRHERSPGAWHDSNLTTHHPG